jgi:hypothetical protein
MGGAQPWRAPSPVRILSQGQHTATIIVSRRVHGAQLHGEWRPIEETQPAAEQPSPNVPLLCCHGVLLFQGLQPLLYVVRV